MTPDKDNFLTVPSEVAALIELRAKTQEWGKINVLDCALAELPQVEMPLNHVVTPVPGLPEHSAYTRSIFLPAGSLITTRVHLYEHPFVVSMGAVSVWSDEKGWQFIEGVHIGVTAAGTRRILYVHKDTIWTSFHVVKESDPDKIVDEVTFDPMRFGHMDGIAPDKLAAVRANCRKNKQPT